jgi:mRNA-degrading endonuclease toxin of MazEF toxin-antitoxin module
MKQWDIIHYPFAEAGPHPAVVISNDERCANLGFSTLNVLICTSLKPGAKLKPTQVMLNGADGLDWETVVKCDAIQLVPRANFGRAIGSVSLACRKQIARTLIECFRLATY